MMSGKAGTGKTESAKHINLYLNNLNLSGNIFSFATGVKTCARDYYGWNGVKDERGRRLLQNVGRTGREYDEDIWVKKTLEAFEKSYDPIGDYLLIDDWRYPNELNKILTDPSMHVVTIRVESPERELLKPGSPEALDSSEMSLPSVTEMTTTELYFGKQGYKYAINNTGTLEDLYSTLDNIIEREIKKLQF
jgi:hypothetical protein